VNLRVDGRVLAYEQFGDEGGTPVVLFHGAPGSRLFCPAAVDGARLITFDRPGYGDSTPRDARTLLDTARDVEALLDHLHVERCALVGWSGGGPHALACAHTLAARVTRLALVSAPGPLDEVPGAWERLGDYQRPTAQMARREPTRSTRAVARHMEPFLGDPASFLGGEEVTRGAAGAMLVAQVTEALRQGATGMAEDMVAMWRDWGFRLRDVHTPTHVFHGALDSNNGEDAQWVAKLLPNATLTVWDDAGHLGIVTNWPEVVAAVAS
jgi:pimeloyl-ACP methyl ester carboxylesterase